MGSDHKFFVQLRPYLVYDIFLLVEALIKSVSIVLLICSFLRT